MGPGKLGKALRLPPPRAGAILRVMPDPRIQQSVEVLAIGRTTLTRPGKESVQLLWPGNSPAAQITITRAIVAPGSKQQRHSHPHSEQVWIIENGHADLLLKDEQSRPIQAGDIVRTPPGEVHGVHNHGTEPFVYLAITTPPIDFRPAYDAAR
jgi:mannose-6-phosphate isomerase-like protein (cupin superfamily)